MNDITANVIVIVDKNFRDYMISPTLPLGS
jgi:hypothetical protein